MFLLRIVVRVLLESAVGLTRQSLEIYGLHGYTGSIGSDLVETSLLVRIYHTVSTSVLEQVDPADKFAAVHLVFLETI